KVKSVSTLHERDSYAGVVCVHARVNRDMAIMKRRDVRDPEKSRHPQPRSQAFPTAQSYDLAYRRSWECTSDRSKTKRVTGKILSPFDTAGGPPVSRTRHQRIMSPLL